MKDDIEMMLTQGEGEGESEGEGDNSSLCAAMHGQQRLVDAQRLVLENHVEGVDDTGDVTCEKRESQHVTLYRLID